MSKKLGCAVGSGLTLLSVPLVVSFFDKDVVGKDVVVDVPRELPVVSGEPDAFGMVFEDASEYERLLLGHQLSGFVSDCFRQVHARIDEDAGFFDRCLDRVVAEESLSCLVDVDEGLRLGAMGLLPYDRYVEDVSTRGEFPSFYFVESRLASERDRVVEAIRALMSGVAELDGKVPVVILNMSADCALHRGDLHLAPARDVPERLSGFLSYLEGLGRLDYQVVDSYSLSYTAKCEFVFPKDALEFERTFDFVDRDPVGSVFGRDVCVLDASAFDNVISGIIIPRGARLFDVAFAYVRNVVRPVVSSAGRELVFAYDCANKLLAQYIYDRARGLTGRSQSDLSGDSFYGYAYVPLLNNDSSYARCERLVGRSITNSDDILQKFARFVR